MQKPRLYALIAVLGSVCTACQPLSWLTPDGSTLESSTWRLVDFGVEDAGVELDAEGDVTLEFSADGRVGGYSGCNLYFGRYQTAENNQLTIDQAASSRRACLNEAMAAREQAFFAALEQTQSWRSWGNQLQLLGDEGVVLLDLESVKMKTAEQAAEDAAREQATSVDYLCTDDAGETINVHARFRSETLDIWLPEGFDEPYHILGQVRSASGVRYQGDGVEAWNKGDTLMLTVGEHVYNQCVEAD